MPFLCRRGKGLLLILEFSKQYGKFELFGQLDIAFKEKNVNIY